MISINDNTRVLILGLGKTGYSCLRYLDKLCQVTVLDSRKEPPFRGAVESAAFQATCRYGELSLPDSELSQFDLIIKSPGLPKELDLFRRIEKFGIPLWGDLDLFALKATKPIVAITGSNGKTTVTDMLGFVINEFTDKKALVGGNIGTPVLELLANDGKSDYYVLELSSFQIETLNHFKAHVATVLNVSDDHLDRYPSFEAYRDVKLSLLDRAERVVINADITANYHFNHKAVADAAFWLERGLAISAQHQVYSKGEFVELDEQQLFLQSELKIKGKHNILNALAVVALGQQLGLSNDALSQGVVAYSGLPHRCQWVGSYNGVDFINDSKATNVGATLAALEGVATGQNIIWLLGGDGKGADFSPLVSSAKGRVKWAFCFGKDGLVLHNLLSPNLACELVSNLEEGVSKAKQVAEVGDVVLLSPACASLDMFSSFEARGNAFVSAVGGES